MEILQSARVALSLSLLVAMSGAVAQDTGATFTAEERQVIEEYVLRQQDVAAETPGPQHPKKALPAGKRLPPGIAKNLQRGKPLPPGIAKRDLPGDLSARLPEHRGYQRVLVDGRVVLIEAATGIVRDMLEDVVFPE